MNLYLLRWGRFLLHVVCGGDGASLELSGDLHSRVHHHRRGAGQARGLPELLLVLARLPALQPAAPRHGEEAALSLCRVCCLYAEPH
jgi:hypothetical protein